MAPPKKKQRRTQPQASAASPRATTNPSPASTISTPQVESTRPATRRSRVVRSRKSNNLPWLIGGGVLVLLIVGFFIFRQSTNVDGVQTFGGLSRDHVDTPVTYAQIPPVGGAHNPAPLKCDVYTEPVPNEQAVHSMEHGAVWITYQPNLAADQVDQLRNLVRGQSYLLLSPYPDLPSPVVASAWGVQLKLDSVSDPRLAQFIKEYKQGPQTPEPGATC